jgi:NAD-dependent SIR2 family protein deacetylase
MNVNFPDLPHLKQLQKDLWQWPRSRAAVMVGAGLSLNAEPRPGVHTHFPTWRELVGSMFDELHPAQPGMTPEQMMQREARLNSASANPLRIASQYEAAFDRQKLDVLIRTQNPDSDYQPGRLHHLLLQLPWADVFTTNYDTLLERTEVPGRTYHPVTKAGELTTAFAPRIVKLHGSFPTQTPFIITEEDFRTYPRKFAPFVNTVQQSLVENSFVLIGFSGEDPRRARWKPRTHLSRWQTGYWKRRALLARPARCNSDRSGARFRRHSNSQRRSLSVD